MKALFSIAPQIFTMIFTSILISPAALAANSEITWTDFKDYRDIDAGSGGQKTFRATIFTNFEKHFAKLAEKLPTENTLKIDVTDVDLAGDTRGSVNNVRVVKNIYPPSMRFSYQLLDAENNVIKENKVSINDKGFVVNRASKYRHSILRYEQEMLDGWFDDEFKSLINKDKK